MTVIYTFAIGTVFALVMSLATVLVLRPHLARLLEEICGNARRASFWIVLSCLCIFLLGVLAGSVSSGYPSTATPNTQQLFFGLITQVRSCLIGLLASLLVLAMMLMSSIRRFEARPPAPEELPHAAPSPV